MHLGYVDPKVKRFSICFYVIAAVQFFAAREFVLCDLRVADLRISANVSHV